MESKLQTEIVKWLKFNGAYVIKTRPGMGTPVGAPDLFAFYQNRWCAVEVKASAKAPFRAGQKATLKHLATYNLNVYVACPENWPQVKYNLLHKFFNIGTS